MSHKILLNKLKHYGLRGTPLKLFASYLHNRTQSESIDEHFSDLQVVKHGVPQGFIFGTTLLIVYMNRFCDCMYPCA